MKENISQLSDLIGLMLSDGKVKEKEYDFLIRIANEMGISQLEVDMMMEKNIEFKPPTSEFERITQFYRLVLLMNVDKEISLKELNYVKDLAIRMGLRPGSTDKILEIMDKYPEKKVPADVLITVFQANHN